MAERGGRIEEEVDRSIKKHHAADDSRGNRDRGSAAAEGREDPIAQDLSELDDVLANEFIQNLLPSPPPIPGFHVCWLSTTNQQDSIQSRMRLGYVPVKIEEIQGGSFETLAVHAGENAGMISCNEMLLYKIPEHRYQRIMQVMHHERPNDEATRLLSNVERIKAETEDSQGKQLVTEEGDGFADERSRVRRHAPKFQ